MGNPIEIEKKELRNQEGTTSTLKETSPIPPKTAKNLFILHYSKISGLAYNTQNAKDFEEAWNNMKPFEKNVYVWKAEEDKQRYLEELRMNSAEEVIELENDSEEPEKEKGEERAFPKSEALRSLKEEAMIVEKEGPGPHLNSVSEEQEDLIKEMLQIDMNPDRKQVKMNEEHNEEDGEDPKKATQGEKANDELQEQVSEGLGIPVARVKGLLKHANYVKLLKKNVNVMLAKSTELFAEKLVAESLKELKKRKKKTLMDVDLMNASKGDYSLFFLHEAGLFSEILKAQNEKKSKERVSRGHSSGAKMIEEIGNNAEGNGEGMESPEGSELMERQVKSEIKMEATTGNAKKIVKEEAPVNTKGTIHSFFKRI